MSVCITGILSLILSSTPPDEQKRLIYSGFKDTAFSPIWLRIPGGGLSFPLNPNQTGFDGIFVYYMSQLHSAEKNMHAL